MARVWEQLGDRLHRARGVCHTYLLTADDTAIAIDPGDGHWLAHLGDIGVRRLEWVLLTHTHRDTCAGVYRLDRAVTKLAVPAVERHLVEDAGAFWRSRQVRHSYNQVDDFLTLPRSVPVDAALEDFDDFHWRDVKLSVEPCPGHSPGSVALVGELGGRRVVFVGDAIEAPGRVPAIHPLQYAYADAAGARLLSHSLRHLLKQQPAVLYPARGEAIDDPARACAELVERLERFCAELYHEPEGEAPGFFALSPHLLQSRGAVCTWYVLRSDDGHGLAIDAGYSPVELAAPCHLGYATRFLPAAADTLTEHGVKKLDAVIPTHYHDDHLIGVPYLRQRMGAEVWCLDRIAPILRDPSAFNMPCLMRTPIPVERTFADRQRFTWRGLELTMHDLPGQTDLHGGIEFTVDGVHYLAMGDSAHLRGGKLSHGHVIFANRVEGTNHVKVARRFLEVGPDVLLHGHARRQVEGKGRGDTPVTRADLEDFLASAERLSATLADLVTDQPHRRCRADWVRVEPYRLAVTPGQGAELTLVAENLHDQPIDLSLRLITPEGITIEKPAVDCELQLGQTHRSAHRVTAEQAPQSPAIIGVVVTLDGQPLGWLGHCQVWCGGTWR